MRTIEPTVIVKGERIEWTRSFGDYPATEFSLQYRFRGNGPGVNVNATVDGIDFVAELSATDSATLAVERYKWQAWITEIADTANTFIAAEGFVNVQAGFAEGSLAAVDLRSPAKIMLDTIDAALAAFATSDVQEYEITTPAGGRRVKRSDKAQLTSQREYWAGIVSRENDAERVRNGGRFGKPIKVSMSSQ